MLPLDLSNMEACPKAVEALSLRKWQGPTRVSEYQSHRLVGKIPETKRKNRWVLRSSFQEVDTFFCFWFPRRRLQLLLLYVCSPTGRSNAC